MIEQRSKSVPGNAITATAECGGCGREIWLLPDGVLRWADTHESEPEYLVCDCGTHIWVEQREVYEMKQLVTLPPEEPPSMLVRHLRALLRRLEWG